MTAMHEILPIDPPGGGTRAPRPSARTAVSCGLLAVLLWTVSGVLRAQTPSIRFDHITYEDGLSNSIVDAVLQDSRGFMWFGTAHGLNRYDGSRFVVYKHDPADPSTLSSDAIRVLLEDLSGDLWIGTMTGGLCRFHKTSEAFTCHRHRAEDPRSLSDNQVSSLYQEPDGTLWIGTTSGLNRWHESAGDGVFERFRNDPADAGSLSSDAVRSLTRDRHGNLWIGTFKGLDRYDRETGTFSHYRHDPADPASLSDDSVDSIFEDRSGGLWVGTMKGLDRLDPSTGDFHHYLNDASQVDMTNWVVAEDRAGRLWVGRDDGLYLRRSQSEPFVVYRHDPADPFSLSHNRVVSIYQDRGGVLWAGAFAGVNKWNPSTWSFGHHKHKDVFALSEDREKGLWIGTFGGGLDRLDRTSGEMEHYRHDPRRRDSLSDDRVIALLHDRQGVLWIGTIAGGLNRFDPGRASFQRFQHDPARSDSLPDNYVPALLETREGELWVGTQGLCRLVGGRSKPAAAGRDRGAFQCFQFNPSDPATARRIFAWHLVEDEAGALWAATAGSGLARLEPTTSRFRYFRHAPSRSHSLSSDQPYVLFVDGSGVLWAGTQAGLNRLENPSAEPAEARFRRYGEQDGLPSNVVFGIEADSEGFLWLATDRGLSRFDPRTASCKNYDRGHGLQADDFHHHSHHRSASGELFFGGVNGFNAFFPNRIEGNTFVPPVELTSFLKLNQPFDLGRPLDQVEEVRLDYRDTVISFEFAALDYAAPRKNRYAYRLEGFTEDWIDLGNTSQVTFTNLDPGRYVLRIRGSNNDGVWNEEGVALPMTVAPPPWQSWWAYSLYVLALSVVVVGFVRSQQKKIVRARESAERERAVSRRLREVDKLKDEFLANTSHELRTPLYGMIGLAESLIDGARGELPETAQSDLSMLLASGRRLRRLIDEILDYSKLTHRSLKLDRRPVDLRSVAEVVLTLLRPLAERKAVVLVDSIGPGLPSADADESRLEQILHNLVGNAIKFTEAGTVEISARPAGGDPGAAGRGAADQLVVTVEDTGIGIPPGKLDQIFHAFEQADSGIQRSFGGTGLGLTVTRQLVELHGGRIWVESAAGKGTRFHFTLPISPQEAAESGAAEQRISRLLEIEPAAAAPLPQGGRPAASAPSEGASRLLIVDDEPVNLQVLANQLASQGYGVELAKDGREALRRLQEREFDLVVLDVMMPRMSGYEVCRALRESHPVEKLPVIFLTAKNQVSDLVAGFSAGGNDYLAKPVSKDELLARVRIHLELSKLHRRLTRLVGELESRNAELARFNYTVSHDLKNPLTTILNFLGLARRDATAGYSERLDHHFDRLEAAAGKLHRLLDDLYELSRVGLPSSPSEKVALGELVRDASEELAGAMAERGIRLVVAKDLPAVRGDRGRLLEVVRQLLDNAVRYMGDPAAPKIEVGVRQEAGEKVFYVRDNGRGIDARYHEKVFGLFERLDPERSEGTGVGLALVKRIVEVHGGRIWVESEGAGRGSTFCLALPGSRADPAEESRSPVNAGHARAD